MLHHFRQHLPRETALVIMLEVRKSDSSLYKWGRQEVGMRMRKRSLRVSCAVPPVQVNAHVNSDDTTQKFHICSERHCGQMSGTGKHT